MTASRPELADFQPKGAAAEPLLLCVTRSPSMRGTRIRACGRVVNFVEPEDIGNGVPAETLIRTRMSPSPRTLVTVWLDTRLDPVEARHLLIELMVEAVGGTVRSDGGL